MSYDIMCVFNDSELIAVKISLNALGVRSLCNAKFN